MDRLSWLFGDALATTKLWPGLTSHAPVVSENGLAVTYILREHQRWHDGTVVGSRHVLEAFHRISGTAWTHSEPYANVRNLTAADERTVTAVLHRPDPYFPFTFFGPLGSPALPLLKNGPAPVGTGPFRIVERLYGTSQIQFAAFAESVRGRPRAHAMRLSEYEASSSAISALRSGDEDVAFGIDPRQVAFTALRTIHPIEETVVLLANVRGTLDTSKLRRGVFAAIDFESIARNVYSWFGGVPRTFRHQNVLGSDIDFRVTSRHSDVRYAAELLSARAPLRFPCVAPPSPSNQVAVLVQAQLRTVGIHVEIMQQPRDLIEAESGPLRTGAYDLALSFVPYDIYGSLQDWSCATIPPQGGNYSQYCDPAFDRDINSQRISQALLRLRDAYVVHPLAAHGETIAIRPDVLGLSASSTSGLPVAFGCEHWYRR